MIPAIWTCRITRRRSDFLSALKQNAWPEDDVSIDYLRQINRRPCEPEKKEDKETEDEEDEEEDEEVEEVEETTDGSDTDSDSAN